MEFRSVVALKMAEENRMGRLSFRVAGCLLGSPIFSYVIHSSKNGNANASFVELRLLSDGFMNYYAFCCCMYMICILRSIL